MPCCPPGPLLPHAAALEAHQNGPFPSSHAPTGPTAGFRTPRGRNRAARVLHQLLAERPFELPLEPPPFSPFCQPASCSRPAHRRRRPLESTTYALYGADYLQFFFWFFSIFCITSTRAMAGSARTVADSTRLHQARAALHQDV